jgi:two-component system chemotaxis sensor kinase CheA
MMDDFEKELMQDFFIEANQLIEATEVALLTLERDNHNIELINEIFRFAHTLKGSARAVGLGEVALFTHEVENLMMQLQKGSLLISSTLVTLLLECNDHVRVMIENLTADPEAKFDSSMLLAKIKNSCNNN